MANLSVNGGKVEYLQSGKGPDLLLLHSLLTELTVFDRISPVLAGSRRVTCINLPGFGASDPLLLISVGDYADHVARTMDAQAIPGAAWHEIADSGHCPMLEQPDALVALMRNFLA